MQNQIVHLSFLAPLLLGSASAFQAPPKPPARALHSHRSQSQSQSRSRSLTDHCSRPSFLKAELGDLPISEPEQLHPSMIAAARQPLSWESPANSGAVPEDDADVLRWQNAQRWYETRQVLMDMWVLPRDLSNGSWDNYAQAANKGEERVLRQVPQLLRLEPAAVAAAARTVLNDLHLPPALLRKEPLLLAMAPERLRGGFESIRKSIRDGSAGPGAEADNPLDACRDTEGLLAEAAAAWTRPDGDGDGLATTVFPGTDTSGDLPDFLGDNKADILQLLQKSFDNEVSADDLHMEPFLESDDKEI